MSELISIIIPCYNSNKFVSRCLRSLQGQTLNKEYFRVIFVDDGSEDPIIINDDLYDFKLDYIRHEENLGLPNALNSALNHVNSRYFVRLDCDDYVHAKFLEILLLKFSLSPNTIAAATDYYLVDQLERIINYGNCSDDPIACGIMFRMDLIDTIGLYNEDMKMAEEIEFRKRGEEIGEIERIAIPLYRYVRHEKNMTNNVAMYNLYKEKLS